MILVLCVSNLCQTQGHDVFFKNYSFSSYIWVLAVLSSLYVYMHYNIQIVHEKIWERKKKHYGQILNILSKISWVDGEETGAAAAV